MENNRLPTTREISVNKIRAARKAAAKIEKVERQVDSVANENKFALLGKSEGVQNAFTTSEMNNELADVLEQRQNKSMKKPKALVHGMGLKTQNQHQTQPPPGMEEKSLRAISQLSHRISPIPRSSSAQRNYQNQGDQDDEFEDQNRAADLRLGSIPQKTEQAHKTQHDFFQSVHDDMADYYFNP